MIDAFSSYQEWKSKGKEVDALRAASSLLEEAFVLMPGLDPSGGQGHGRGLGLGRRDGSCRMGEGDISSIVVQSMRCQQKVMELNEILCKIEGMQRLCRRAFDEGDTSEIDSFRSIIRDLFGLAHKKLEDAKSAFMSEMDVSQAKEPKIADPIDPLSSPKEPVLGEEVPEPRISP